MSDQSNGEMRKNRACLSHVISVGKVLDAHSELRAKLALMKQATRQAAHMNDFMAQKRDRNPSEKMYHATVLPDWFLNNDNLELWGLPLREEHGPSKSNSGRTNLRITQRHLIEKQAEDIAHKALLEGICAEIKQLIPKSKLGKLLEQYETTLGNSLSGEIAKRIPCCLGGDAGTEHLIALDTLMQENLPK